MNQYDHSMAVEAAFMRAERFSPFLRGAIGRNPDIVDALGRLGTGAAVAEALASKGASIRQSLRKRRDALALAIGIGDLAGLLSLEEAVLALSDFADQALDDAIGHALDSRIPNESHLGFSAIALGKLGGRELNYSSDIDPILLFDPDTLPRRTREEPVEAAVRIARHVIETLQARDADGYVLRVDLRLRPSPEATPIALPVDAAISHYESSALGWERAAFVRARAGAGDVALGNRFLEAISPFIWRRTLDFGALGELRTVSRRIRAHHAAGQRFGPGFDLKRGRGGIREVEFFVQIHQLIHGGRNPALRIASTLPAIEALRDAGLIQPQTAATLTNAYRLYRTIEHRLQMVDDLQTHSLPQNAEALDGVARLHGLDGGDALLALLAPHVEAVGVLYDGLDPTSANSSRATFGGLPDSTKFRNPEAALRRIAYWRTGTLRALRSAAASEAFEALLPELIEAFEMAPDPDAAIAAFDRLLTGLPSAINLFHLLEAQPALLAMLIAILSHAPALAEALGNQPALLDHLIDRSAFEPAGSVEAIGNEMASGGKNGLERLLDRVRQIVGEQRFALGTQIVTGAANPYDVAAGYARLAEAAVGTVAAAVIGDFVKDHGSVPQSEFVVVALGRLGGGSLTHASDLDLIYLFSGEHTSLSDGRKPLGASHYYNRLAQRVSAGLSVATAAGRLYDVDTRLRPCGAQGPLAVSFTSFERYQREDAWTWEHMALTRARAIFGSEVACRSFTVAVSSILQVRTDTRKLAGEVVAMRNDMSAHKPPTGPLDVKLGESGLIDLEFVVHFHQLASGTGLDPDLRRAIGALSEAGLVANDLIAAHDLLTRFLVTMRLVAPDGQFPVATTQPIVAKACGKKDWRSLVAEIETARQSVRAHWRIVVQTAGEA